MSGFEVGLGSSSDIINGGFQSIEVLPVVGSLGSGGLVLLS
jgi:hypothetical protein